mmetsp:Transcript_97852/g.276906  ORF Transcript_97852/g.276906 Transcript_97852/m.276906 type:complete len:307 (-) Transcript_97852:67-987(-)
MRPPMNMDSMLCRASGQRAALLSLLTVYTVGGSIGDRQSSLSGGDTPVPSRNISHASASEAPARTMRSTPTNVGCRVLIIGKSERSEWSGRTRRLLTLKTSPPSWMVLRSFDMPRRSDSGTELRARPATCAGKFWERRISVSRGVVEDLIFAAACRPMSLISQAFRTVSVSRSASSCSFRAHRRDLTTPLGRLSSTWRRSPSISSGPSNSLSSCASTSPSSAPSPPPLSPASSPSPSCFSSACVLYSLLLIASSKPYPVSTSPPLCSPAGPSACRNTAPQGEAAPSASTSPSSGARLGRPPALTAP